MKILHTSDWHLGMSLNMHDLMDDQQYFIDRICGIIEEQGVGAVMLCGDVFDRSVPSAEAVGLYDRTVTRICAGMGVKLLIAAGNHDSPARLATYAGLVKAAGLHVAGVLDGVPEPVELGGADVYMLPWFSVERARALFPEQAEEIDSLEAAYGAVLDAVRARFRPGRRNILMAHAYIVDAATSVSDRAAEMGRASAVGSGVFGGFDYVALGHLHGPQDVGPAMRYSGTPMKYSFGTEERQEKSVTIVDTESMERTVISVPALHERTTVSGTLEELCAGAGLDEARRRGYVRAEVSDHAVTLGTYTLLQESFPLLQEAVGVCMEREGSRITMTPEELRNSSGDPEEVFRSFCADTMQGDPQESFLKVFRAAVEQYERSCHEAD